MPETSGMNGDWKIQGSGMKKKKMGQISPENDCMPRAYPLKIAGTGYFRQDIPKRDKF
jgi:hypothetical protein